MSWRICQCYLIPATRASGRAAAVVAVTLVDRFMTSQAMNQLCWHHAQMGDRVRREVGAEGMGTEPNWGETQAMAEQTTSKERSHNPRSGFGGIRTKTVLPRFQERSQVSQLLPKWTSIRSKPGSIVGQEDINCAIITEFLLPAMGIRSHYYYYQLFSKSQDFGGNLFQSITIF